VVAARLGGLLPHEDDRMKALVDAERCEPLTLDAGRAWFTAARRCPSPNHDARPPTAAVELVVLHNISLPPGEFGTGCVERLFLNRLDPDAHPFFAEIRALRVSAHLFIDRHGELVQFVSLRRRAWHAGQSCFQGREACNDFSVGIEIEGTDTLAYERCQYVCLVRVLEALGHAFPALSPRRLVGHCDIAPGRKTDPGPAFDWAWLRRELGRLGTPWAA
jgi:AmpD protein